MNVSLTSELDKFVAEQVESGMYQTASEVVRDGLRLLKEKEELRQHRLAQLRAEIQIGIDQVENGDFIEVKSSEDLERLFESIKQRGQERLAQRNA